MIQLQNFFFFITSMVVPRGTAAPVLLKWFVSRDVPTGAPSSNGTIIPIPIPEFPFLVYLHSRKFIRSMDRAKSGVLVKASRPILLPNIIGRSSSARNALFRFVPVLHFLLLESMGDLSYLESFCGLLCLQFFRTLFSLGAPRDRSSKRERRRKGQTLRPTGNEQGRNDKMRYPGHPHIERRGEGFGPVACEKPAPPSTCVSSPSDPSPIEVIYEPPRPRGPQNNLLKAAVDRLLCGAPLSPLLKARVDYCFHSSPSSSGACLGGVPPEIGLEALALPTSRLLMAVGHDYYKKVKMNLPISHGGVCIFMLGVLLSCDPVAYARPVAHASYLFRAGGVNSDSIRVFNPAAEMLS